LHSVLGWNHPRPEHDVKLLNLLFNFTQTMDNNQFQNDISSDTFDAMADMAYEQEQAIRESNQSEWTLIEDNGKFIGFSVTNAEEYDDES